MKCRKMRHFIRAYTVCLNTNTTSKEKNTIIVREIKTSDHFQMYAMEHYDQIYVAFLEMSIQ